MNQIYYRNLISGINVKVPLMDGSYCTAINFDNAATTPPFHSVIQQIIKFIPFYASVHRGAGYKCQFCTSMYEKTRKVVAKFVNADLDKSTVIFVSNTTEGLNRLSNIFYEKYKKYVVLSTDMEHHSNDLPWRKYELDYVPVDKYGRITLENLEKKLKEYKGKVKIVTISGASNVTGYRNDIYKAAEIVHKYGAKIIVDGAQLVPHAEVNMRKGENNYIDYLVFSAHKMYAPFGGGALIGPKEELEKLEPDYKGGGTVDFVTHDFVMWADDPLKDEPGTPNAIGAIALGTAIKTLQMLGMKNIEKHENSLVKYALYSLRNIPDLKLYCDKDNEAGHISVISFNIEGVHHEIVAKILSYEFGIAVRTGCFCAEPYVQKLVGITPEQMSDIINEKVDPPGMVRVSLGLYNNQREIDILVYALNKIVRNKQAYIDKYKSIDNSLFF
ncbi:aminotransferase class V-fold PLP-dependent enzyme [Clostridium aestuarii]|uniref:Aminotransferase class V-fold PLP-dependent enzyme n=1 Tax=Clostridium aestuarii TaxID=338193 RepID=A0ABT4D222_9CLOT|nr:aminotransferase class V-fold PLP-dependent enzyme [Clostridium aestuarii]MCY6485291.1 aminotransferase class V-fold PLP-dependent enzyme [Clostridium aestuarii]